MTLNILASPNLAMLLTNTNYKAKIIWHLAELILSRKILLKHV